MTLLCADRVWDGVADRAIERGFVAVDGDRITAVGRQSELGSRFEHHDLVDLNGATILPGLINGHVHMTFSASATPVEDYLREASSGPCALTLRAVNNLQEAAAVGVTTVRDLGTLDDVAFAVREAASDGRIFSPRVITSGRPITITGGHCHWFSHQCDTEEQVRTAVRRQVGAGADLIKIFATGGNLTPRTNPFAPQYTQSQLDACVAEAERLNVSVAAHAHAPEGIRRAVRAGASTIEHCLFETPDGVDFDPAVADEMARAGIAFCPTTGASLLRMAAAPPEERSPVVRRLLAKLPLLREAFCGLLAAGVPLLAGSDAGIPNRRFTDYPEDVAVLAGDLFGLAAIDALRSATSGGAAILRLDDCGILRPGRRADIIAVTGDPLAKIHDLARTRFVMIGGRVCRQLCAAA